MVLGMGSCYLSLHFFRWCLNFDVARALRHGLLIPVMLSGILAAVAMEWWECCLVCACGVVIGWKARGVLRAEATESKTEPPSSEWASEI